MHGHEKSDRPVVPANPPNNAGAPVAEAGEGSGLGKENATSKPRPGLRAGLSVPDALDRVRRVAKQDKDVRFTALLHHVDVDRLREAFWALNPKAATGVDGVTWQDYGENLEANLRDLHSRVHRGAYRARPSRRVYIPKADGRQRPLGVAALEDKILQRAAVKVLNAIYEADFLGFSYGFRPGRSPHRALDALAVGILRRKVGWVLDADIRGFYDAIDHGWRYWVPLGTEWEGWNDVRAGDRRDEIAAAGTARGLATTEHLRARSPGAESGPSQVLDRRAQALPTHRQAPDV